jgi:hypothetical protein
MTNLTITQTFTCDRCDGSGKVRWARHYAGGDCFACGTSGRVTVKASVPNRAELLQQVKGLIDNRKAAQHTNDMHDCPEADINYIAGLIVCNLRGDLAVARRAVTALGQYGHELLARLAQLDFVVA